VNKVAIQIVFVLVMLIVVIAKKELIELGKDVLLVKIYVQNALLVPHALAANRICFDNYREDNVNVKMVIMMLNLQLHVRNVFINVKLAQMEFPAHLVRVLIDFLQINSAIVK
jgi:hypothetical protein